MRMHVCTYTQHSYFSFCAQRQKVQIESRSKTSPFVHMRIEESCNPDFKRFNYELTQLEKKKSEMWPSFYGCQ